MCEEDRRDGGHVQGVQWIGLGELPNDLFGMQWQWLQQRLGNAASTLGARADRPDTTVSYTHLTMPTIYSV